jgi:hypothetical protein
MVAVTATAIVDPIKLLSAMAPSLLSRRDYLHNGQDYRIAAIAMPQTRRFPSVHNLCQQSIDESACAFVDPPLAR